MPSGKVTLVCNLKNTFVVKDIALLEQMGYQVLVIHSPSYSDPLRFFLESDTRSAFKRDLPSPVQSLLQLV